MYFYANGSGFSGTYCGLDWHVTRLRCRRYRTALRWTKLEQYASLTVLWDIIDDLLRISRH